MPPLPLARQGWSPVLREGLPGALRGEMRGLPTVHHRKGPRGEWGPGPPLSLCTHTLLPFPFPSPFSPREQVTSSVLSGNGCSVLPVSLDTPVRAGSCRESEGNKEPPKAVRNSSEGSSKWVLFSELRREEANQSPWCICVSPCVCTRLYGHALTYL